MTQFFQSSFGRLAYTDTEAGTPPLILVAHDLGASVAMDYMGKYGQYVAQLILMSPPVYPDFQEPQVVKVMRTPYLGEGLTAVLQDFILHSAISNAQLVIIENGAHFLPIDTPEQVAQAINGFV